MTAAPGATGIGSWPGEDEREAIRIVLGELADDDRAAARLPFLPELPARGVIAGMTGRTLAMVAELGVDLQPAGWRLTGGGSGVDHRRARSLLAQDLDALEELAAEYRGPLKVQVAGPWTVAATTEKPRGDRVLADHGARRDLADALAEGLAGHLAALRRRLPSVTDWIVQVDEPALGAVVAGAVPTASGFGRHRSVDLPEARDLLGRVLGAAPAATPWVHSCAPGTPWRLVREAGARGLLVDVAVLGAADHDVLAEALEAGATVGLGVVPSTDPAPGAGAAAVGEKVLTERVLRWLDLLGLDPAEVGDHLVVTPACGLAGATATWARRALTLSATTARHLRSGG